MLKLVEQYEEVSPLIRKYFKPNIKTNHFMTEEDYRIAILQSSLYYYELNGGIIFLKKRNDNFKLTYQIIDMQNSHELENVLKEVCKDENLPIVLEIVKRPNDKSFNEVEEFWKNKGLKNILTRFHMSYISDKLADKKNPFKLEDKKIELNENLKFNIEFCGVKEKNEVVKLLHDCFDVHTGCIPTNFELEKELEAGHILGAFDLQNNLIGMLHFSKLKASSEIRHLAVSEIMRNNGVAQTLIEKYHNDIVENKANLWVSFNNEIAQRFYKKNGYEFDGWESFVYILKI